MRSEVASEVHTGMGSVGYMYVSEGCERSLAHSTVSCDDVWVVVCTVGTIGDVRL